MRTIILLLSALLLAGCAGSQSRESGIASYDLGSLACTWTSPGFPVAAVSVQASSWLNSQAQLYRLAYADDLRRHSYAESRWAAPPAELIERLLQQHIVYGQMDHAGRGCRLQLVLDELEQRFDTPDTSKSVLEVRASLLPPHGDAIVSRRDFRIEEPAMSADARGGVRAARIAVQTLAHNLSQWLAGVARTQPGLAGACM